MTRIVALHLVIRGAVQGVGFRDAMADVATEAGVHGWVRNLRDGGVEAYVHGDAQAVERIVGWCRRGPPVARVASVEAEAVAVDIAVTGFSRRPTS